MEKVIGYRRVWRDRIVSRPCHWEGESGVNKDGFVDHEPVTTRIRVLEPIYKDLGPKVNITMDGPVLPIREVPLWGLNTDDATGKHKKGRDKKEQRKLPK